MERMNSLAPSTCINHQTDGDVESETVSEAGDIGDRALHTSSDFTPENGVVSIPGDQKLQPSPVALSSISIGKPSAQLVTSRYSNGKGGPEHIKEHDKGLPNILDYVSCMIHLAAFGILGVLTRYLLQKLFGPDGAGVTSDHTILYLDLPSNMVGSFLMGWFGVVFKGHISRVSEHLTIAITTGYLGSLTTFSGWNQKMVELSVAGHWLFSVLGFIIGLFLVGFSIIFGIETAKGFKWLISRLKMRSRTGSCNAEISRKVHSYKRQLAVMAVCLVMLGFLWGLSSTLVRSEFKHGHSGAEPWLACLVGPLGVWIRWFLARLNGRGVGRARLLIWIPFGTLIANVSAACVMSALATVKKSANTWKCDTIVTGIQFGLLGCLSTVSTFASEFNAMRESMQPWRAYAYAMITICVSFCFGILIFCMPVWQMSLA
ncbi:fluoride export protein 2-like [Neltuma alba]|uniref:fluoride export protein 2-like n=1 Tax=Neltuma alba TaxID=207710 RepID=UPI0010A45766|nr:fluoride export protein 2-like [Prosopis alba]